MKPGFEPTVISFHGVVGVAVQDVPRTRSQLLEHARVDRRPVGRDLDRRRTEAHRGREERPCGRAIATLRQQHVDDLAMLIDRAIQVGPPPCDLDVGLIDEPAIAD